MSAVADWSEGQLHALAAAFRTFVEPAFAARVARAVDEDAGARQESGRVA